MSKRNPVAAEPLRTRIDGNLSPEEVAAIISEGCHAEPVSIKKDGKSFTFFTPHAWEYFAATVHYGKLVPENELECQCFLEGYYFIDKAGRTSTVITNIITVNSASQGRTSAQLYNKDFNAYASIGQKESELIKLSSAGKDYLTGGVSNPLFKNYGPPHRSGFNHTHPGLGVFFSAVDKTSIFAAHGEPWVTMVTDPRRQELLAVTGAEMKPSEIIIFKNKTEKPEDVPIEPQETDTANENINEFIEFIKFMDTKINSNCSAKIKLIGKLPGKLKFKGEVAVKKAKNSGFLNRKRRH